MGSLIPVGPVGVQMEEGCRVEETYRLKGEFERQSLAHWARIVKPGRGALDVGAYSGLYAIAASLLGADNVTAVEPFPRMMERAKANARLNGAHIHFIEKAASDWSGPTTLWLNSRVKLTSGGSLIRPGEHGGALHKESIGVVVDQFRIDDMAWAPFKAMKIDVEGWEVNVIRGGIGTIRAYRPTILLEWRERMGPPDEINAMLSSTHKWPVSLDGRNLLYEPI